MEKLGNGWKTSEAIAGMLVTYVGTAVAQLENAPLALRMTAMISVAVAGTAYIIGRSWIKVTSLKKGE